MNEQPSILVDLILFFISETAKLNSGSLSVTAGNYRLNSNGDTFNCSKNADELVALITLYSDPKIGFEFNLRAIHFTRLMIYYPIYN